MEGNNVDEIRLTTISDQCHLPGVGPTALRDQRSSALAQSPQSAVFVVGSHQLAEILKMTSLIGRGKL